MAFRELVGNLKLSDAAAHISPWPGTLTVDPDSMIVYVQNGVTPGTPLNVIKSARVNLTPAIFATLQATPYPAIPAPGPGFINIVHEVFYSYLFGTTPYSGDSIQIWYGGSISADIGTAGLYTGSVSAGQQSLPWSAINGANFEYDICENAVLNVWSPGAAITGGDGTGSVTIFYSTIAV